MSATRKFAARLLRFVIRHSPHETQAWGNAMLRELDFIESDWAALLWALGSTTAIFRQSGRAIAAKFGKLNHQKEAAAMNNIGKRAAGFAAGITVGAVFIVIAVIFVHLLLQSVVALHSRPMPWFLASAAIVEAIFFYAVAKQWGKRRPMAVGILLSALVLGTHVIIHVTTHALAH
jgi:hypothetical protein